MLSRNTNRKTKTFSEILNEKARSGGRIGYNLHRYADVEDAEEEMKRNEERKGKGSCSCNCCISSSSISRFVDRFD